MVGGVILSHLILRGSWLMLIVLLGMSVRGMNWLIRTFVVSIVAV
jgi:hypothetical protein